MNMLRSKVDFPLAETLQNLLVDVPAREAVPVLAEALAALCMRAGVGKINGLHLAQLAMELITERLDHSGYFEGADDETQSQ